tara:strand:+ start:6523 stop:7452 length:930 start_codon:yes stop_codon:yes gene_type:complete
MEIIPDFEVRTKCPICSRKRINLIISFFIRKDEIKLIKNIYKESNSRFVDPFINKKVLLYKCNKCKFIFHKYIPDNKTLNFIYTKLINRSYSLEKYNKNKFSNSQKANKLLYRLKSAIKISPFKKINYLDFGFGWGCMLYKAADIGLVPYGIEYNKLQKEMISKHNIKAYTSIDKLRDKENDNVRFSIITINQVLEHLKDPKEALEEIRKISAKTSILYIAVPKYMNDKNLSKSDILKKGSLQPFEHLNCFSRKSIKMLAQKTNWKLLGFYSIFNNLFLILRNYNIFTILLLCIHSKLRKGTYYLIPKI